MGDSWCKPSEKEGGTSGKKKQASLPGRAGTQEETEATTIKERVRHVLLVRKKLSRDPKAKAEHTLEKREEI